MTADVLGHGSPWTDEEFLAIGETPERIELFDGSLHVTPAPTPRHQIISRRLANALDHDPGGGFQVLEAVNVRLRQGRVTIPDIVVTETPIDFDESIVDVGAVRLVCEITSPSNASTDRVLKMHYYAAAGIPWYLLVDQETGSLHLFELTGERYTERSVAKAGEFLRLTDPVDVTLCPADLLPPR